MSSPPPPSQSPKKASPARLAGSPRALALKVLEGIELQHRSPESLIHQTLTHHPDLARPDRAFLLELVQGVLRWQLRLDFVISQVSAIPIKKLHPLVLRLLRLTVYQLLFLNRIPPAAAVNEAIRLAKSRHLPSALVSFVNATLRRLAAEGKSIAFPARHRDPVHALAVATSHPPWLAARWLRRLGEAGAWQRCNANNQIPPRTIRVNTSKTSLADLQAVLAQEGLETKPCRFSPVGLTITSLEQPPLSLNSYRQGLWLFQDEAAQLVTYLLGVEPGQQILEIGAGRGGKTTHLAQMVGHQGHILALDQNQRRLAALQQNMARWGMHGVSAVVADATLPLPFPPRWHVARVLIDAPCSGLGTIRRHPELRWRRAEADFPRYAARQLLMLRHAAQCVQPGGVLLYITCSTEPEENEEVIEALLAAEPGFRLRPEARALPEAARHLLEPSGYFRTLPERDDLDGFFAAVLIRVAGTTQAQGNRGNFNR